MRQKQTRLMTAMRRVTARGTVLAGLLLLLTFVAHHGIAAAGGHPLNVRGKHTHSHHHHHHDTQNDHDPDADPVQHPKRCSRWSSDTSLPDTSRTSSAVLIRLIATLPESVEIVPPESPPVLAGAERRLLFQVFRI
jgi:hypothetical protein